ncbi:histidine kinase [Crassaminicella thermophila]|uniref:histidine kinase n=1 Tax=Crassaminicella thermophila TaxID=2599308 RepID=A0A5C0SEQ8_CRATE|nr:sensor histidine kinase [Crassaminicella thermophila]QEK12650.1 histidine kinase [Crassaminicella thermophila]
MLKEICRKYTDLSYSDIKKLENTAEMLPIIADLVRADVFIDCLVRDSDVAIVVAEAKPFTGQSMYESSVVGQLAYRKDEPAALRTLEIGMATRDLKAVTQEKKTVIQNTIPIKNEQEKVIGVLIMEQDATEHLAKKRQMEILSETAEQLGETLLTFKDHENNITKHINDAIVIFNKSGISTYANPGAIELYRKLGYKDEIVGMNFENLVLDGISFKKIIVDSSFETSEVKIGNLSLQTKYAAMKQKNKVVGVIMFIKDITEVKEKEKELILKSVAIKEIHHRVKNNLQTIASLLRLQSRRIDNDLVKKAFNESISRILSIAVTHELLAQKGVDDIDIKTILSKLKDTTIDYGISPDKNIEIEIKGDSVIVNSDKATSIALVVNELLQNSVEHAFKSKKSGLIEIWIQKGCLYSSISVIDNGSGFDAKFIKTESLGHKIVEQIVKDRLSGHLSIESNISGTKIMFDFKNG